MMRFGVFLPNGSNGYMMSSAVEPYPPTWEHNREIVLEAESCGFDFALPMIKFRGFGGATGCWDACLEPFTLSSALAAVTSRIVLFPTGSMLAMHPAYLARTVATLSDISAGRCGVNLITGWNRPEYSQMGLWPGDKYYARRYEYASEYVRILRALWEKGRYDHQSEWFTLEDCSCEPLPTGPVPVISAGQSPAGVRFCEEFADCRFMIGNPDVIARLEADRKAARPKKNGSYLLLHLLAAPSDEQAEAIGRDIVEQADHEAIATMLSGAGGDTSTGGTSEALRAGLTAPMEAGNMAFGAHPVVHGSYETVAKKLDEIAERTDCDGFMFAWRDYVTGVREFAEHIRPRMRCA